MGATGATDSDDGSDSSSDDGGITSFGTFLFHTFDISIQVTSGDLDLLRRL